MKKENIEVFICEYCGLKNVDESFMKTHEECCPENPKNHPCSKCENQIVGMGCSAGMDMNSVGGNVLCFRYKKGEPKILSPMLLKMMGNIPPLDENPTQE